MMTQQHELVTAILKAKTNRLLLNKPIASIRLHPVDISILKEHGKQYISENSNYVEFMFAGLQVFEEPAVPQFLLWKHDD